MTDALHAITAADVTDDAPLGATLLTLNNAHELELSRLDIHRLKHLIAHAFFAKRIGDGAALLIAFDQNADYDSPNFLWFRNRFERFVYIDRIVVDERARGQGHARTLYADLFRKVCDAGHDRIVCEVNVLPPNSGSDAFHDALGFEQIGVATLSDGQKTVRYLQCLLAALPQA